MKKQPTLLKGAIIAFTFFITTLTAGCSLHLADNSVDNYAPQHMMDLPEYSIFSAIGNIGDLDQMIKTESDLSKRDLLTGSSPLISACLFAKKIFHCW